ncbi:CDC73-domain-containing protein [Atractiella rhizophila]|nr:CDC73-domain-containing protein [Atractiella rhizophila]
MENDPLLVLRATLTNKLTITLLDDSSPANEVYTISECSFLSFPVLNEATNARITLPKTTPTRFRKPGMSGTDPTTSPADFYDLQSLLNGYLMSKKSFGEYVQECHKMGVSFISATERKQMVDYLDGVHEHIPSVIEPQYAIQQEGGLVDMDVGMDGADAGGTQIPDEPRGTKRRYVVDKADQEFVAKLSKLQEGRQILDRNTVLRGVKKNNFESVRTLLADRIKQSREDAKRLSLLSQNPTPAVQPAMTPSQKVQDKNKRRPLHPIIVISPSSTALITMHNVKHFLEDAVFESSDQARKSSGMKMPDDVVAIHHLRTTSTISASLSSGQGIQRQEGPQKAAKYFVVDGVDALAKFGEGEEAWDRVVCVMTTGQEWQFRPYKWSEPKELFHHVKGVYVRWTSDPPNPKVLGWNVTELKIDPHKRHIDKSVVADFWRSLEAWIASHKPWLAF